MLRTTRGLALALLFLAGTLGASPAAALSSVDLVWKHTSDTHIDPSSSTTVTALIVLQGDSVGVGGVFVTISYDTVGLDAISAIEHSGKAARVGMGNQFSPTPLGVTISEATGEIFDFGSATIATGCIHCTVTLGSVIFHVASYSNTNFPFAPPDVELTILPNGIDGIVSASGGLLPGTVVTATFGGLYIGGIPEPGTATLVSLGVVSLAWSARRRR